MSWQPFLAGVLAGGVIMAGLLFVLMISSEAQRRRELQQAQDEGYERGFHRGWAERAMKGRVELYPSDTHIRELQKSDVLRSAAIGSTLLEVCAEADLATSKYPTWPTDPLHAFAVVGEEFGEAQKEVLQLTYEPHKSTPESVRKEALQLAAMSLRFLMSLDRYQYRPGLQHFQDQPSKVPCAACDRGDFQLGHAEGCAQNSAEVRS